jgi:hypothetical protein
MRTLSLDDVFAWRQKYGDLLGKPKEAAIERYGPPRPATETEQLLEWKASEKTDNRNVSIALHAGPNGKAIADKVFARDDEQIDPTDVLKKSNLLNFETGTYRDSATNYLICTTKDKRNSIQLDVSDAKITFRAAMFAQSK